LAVGVAVEAQGDAVPAVDLHHRLAALRALVLRLDRGGALLLALARLDVLALLVIGAADEALARLAAELLHQRLAALGTRLAGLLAGAHLGLGPVQRLGERPPELVEDGLVFDLPRLDLVQLLR